MSLGWPFMLGFLVDGRAGAGAGGLE
jgi:hypothetical protein